MDSTPYADLRWSLDRLGDDRIWVYADWIGHQFAPKNKDGSWQPFYHNKLYELTDEAVRACPPDTEWVVITNGDNLYHESALEYLETAKGDVVAWDMYSRYQRPSGIPCERFQASEGDAPCKVNRLKWCHTDLGATAYRWRRLVEEDRRFGGLDKTGVFTGQDGVMAGQVVEAGWPVDHAEGRCLFDQGPSPQMCAYNKGVWDERTAGKTSGFGGTCITRGEAEAALAAGGVEALSVDLTHDGAFSGFGGDAHPVNFTIQCLRPQEGYRHMLARSFGPACAEAQDAFLHEELAAMKAQA